MRKIPPFASRVQKSIIEGYKNNIYFYIGYDAQERASNMNISRPCLFLPPYECPSKYIWPVKNAEILVFEREKFNDEFLNDLAYWLFQDGASKVTVWKFENGESIIFNQ